MQFRTMRAGQPALSHASEIACLYPDNWDDWHKYRTMFTLMVIDAEGTERRIGSVKIGQKALLPAGTVGPGQRAPQIPDTFEVLSEDFFSLGQGEDYYTALNSLDQKLKTAVLVGLRDCAYDLQIFDKFSNETVMGESLLRSVREAVVRGRLSRLAHGDAKLTPFHFQHTIRTPPGIPPATLTFQVTPDAQPPTNVHVLIGRNGVGKTRCMREMALSALGRDTNAEEPLSSAFKESDSSSFSRLVLISFSAFDDFVLVPAVTDRIAPTQVGLRHNVDGVEGVHQGGLKTPDQLASDFRGSLQYFEPLKEQRWLDALKTLEADDLFAEAQVGSLLGVPRDEDWVKRAEGLFKRLSSGHAIVLLTVTRLVELVDEKALVLIDEPEGHLHPPLLSAFIRCLSDLLVKRNGVAVIATHSPVVLQEVPCSCVWKIRRSGAVSIVERPAAETFGENIGILTRDAFGLDVTRSGFHQLLIDLVGNGLDYDSILLHFDNQLGDESKAILRALIAERGGQQ